MVPKAQWTVLLKSVLGIRTLKPDLHLRVRETSTVMNFTPLSLCPIDASHATKPKDANV